MRRDLVTKMGFKIGDQTCAGQYTRKRARQGKEDVNVEKIKRAVST
jgi:hypothetical protein